MRSQILCNTPPAQLDDTTCMCDKGPACVRVRPQPPHSTVLVDLFISGLPSQGSRMQARMQERCSKVAEKNAGKLQIIYCCQQIKQVQHRVVLQATHLHIPSVRSDLTVQSYKWVLYQLLHHLVHQVSGSYTSLPGDMSDSWSSASGPRSLLSHAGAGGSGRVRGWEAVS